MHKVKTNFSRCIAGAVKIYVAAVLWVSTPFFASFFFNLTPCMTKLRVRVLCFPYFTNNYDFFIFKKANQ
jgi:hypothetical protein